MGAQLAADRKAPMHGFGSTEPQERWSSCEVAQGSKDNCSNEQGRNGMVLYDLPPPQKLHSITPTLLLVKVASKLPRSMSRDIAFSS